MFGYSSTSCSSRSLVSRPVGVRKAAIIASVLLGSLLTSTGPAGAREHKTRPPPGSFYALDPARLVLELGGGYTGLESSGAARYRYDNVGVGFTVAGSLVIYDLVSASLGVSTAWPLGQESFSQATVETGTLIPEQPESSRSSLKVVTGTYMLGVRSPMLSIASRQRVGLGLFAEGGYAAIHGKNSIFNCSGCRSVSLPLNNGPVLRAGIELAQLFRRTRKMDYAPGVAFSYLHFFGQAGLAREVRLSLTLSLG